MLCFLWLQSEKALCCAGWLIISASWEYQVIVTYSLVSPRNESRGEMYVFFSSLFLPLLQSPPVPPACGLAEVSVRTGGFCQRERERDMRDWACRLVLSSIPLRWEKWTGWFVSFLKVTPLSYIYHQTTPLYYCFPIYFTINYFHYFSFYLRKVRKVFFYSLYSKPVWTIALSNELSSIDLLKLIIINRL